MGFWDFLKKKLEEEIEENKEKRKINFGDIEAELEKEIKIRDNKKQEAKNLIKKAVSSFNSELGEQLPPLKNISLEKKKEPDKIKLVVKDNLNLYISQLQSLMQNLEALEEDEKYVDNVRKIMHNFQKSSSNSFEKATILIGKELERVLNSIRNFSENFNTIVNENKILFGDEKDKILKEVIKKYKQEQEMKKQIEKSIENKKDEAGKLEKIKENEENKLNELRKSSDYQEDIKKKGKIKQEKEKLSREIFKLKEEIDLKLLARHFHTDKKKSQIIKHYSENFESALKEDALPIAQLIHELKPEFNTEKIEKIKEKLTQEAEETEIEKREKEKIKEIERIKQNISEILREIETENKRKEKIQEKIKQLKQEIITHSNSLWKNIEIIN